MADTVLTDEQAEKIVPIEEKNQEEILPLDHRVDELEKAMEIVMGFFKKVLPSDWKRYMRNEIKLAERPQSPKELRV